MMQPKLEEIPLETVKENTVQSKDVGSTPRPRTRRIKEQQTLKAEILHKMKNNLR